MQKLKSLAIALAALGGALAASNAAQAQACITFQTATVSGTYNPFSPTGTITQQLTLTAHRMTYSGGGYKTQEVDFFFLTPPGTDPGYQITWQNSGNSILEQPPGHTLVFSNSQTNQVYIDYGGVGQSDDDTFTVNLTVPINADLEAGDTLIPFGLKYYCKMTGGGNNPDIQGTVANALNVQIHVLSALRASFAGSNFDFGDVGKIKTADLGAAQELTGALVIASTGPYDVDVTSDNNYRLVLLTGDPSNVNQRMDYEMDLLGQQRTHGDPIFTTVTCERAGIVNHNIPIKVKLLEGGSGKALSMASKYQDYINVKFTPLAVPTTKIPVACF